MARKIRQHTEWRIEWIDAFGDIQHVDHADTKREALLIIRGELDATPSCDFEELCLSKERSRYFDDGDGDGELIEREATEVETFRKRAGVNHGE